MAASGLWHASQTLDKHRTNWGVYDNMIRSNHNSHLSSEFLIRILGNNLADCRHCCTTDLTNKFWTLSNLKSPQLSRRLNLSGGYYVTVLRHRCFVNMWWPLQNDNCANPISPFSQMTKTLHYKFFKSIDSSSVSCIRSLGCVRTLQNIANLKNRLHILSNVHSSRITSVINLSPSMFNSMIMFLALATHDCQKDQMIFVHWNSHLMKR